MTKSKGKAKAKWLQEGTVLELLTIVEDTLYGELEQKEVNKAKKALEEVIDRLPEEEQELSVEEAIQALREVFEAGLENIANAYGAELEAIGEDDDSEEDLDEEDDDSEEDLDEEDDDSEEDLDEEDDEEIDYSGMTLKELRAECRDRDIKGTKGLKKADLIALLEDSEEDEDLDEEDIEDEEDFDDEDDDEEELEAYEDMTLKDLRSECRERGIKVKKGMKKADFIEVLEADDED